MVRLKNGVMRAPLFVSSMCSLFQFIYILCLVVESHSQWFKPWCVLKECCNDRWVTKDLQALKSHLRSNVFGQHLVYDVVLGSLSGHTGRQLEPQRPLVLSFHGSTGTGKNFVSQWITESWFKKGMESKYVHVFSGTKNFPFKSRLDEYKEELQRTIIRATEKCKYQIFIFDEIDSFPPGLLDSVSTFLDYHPRVDGVDYRNTIFIFLSNTGDEVLREITNSYYQSGSERENIKLGETERQMIKSIFSTEDKGLTKSRLIDHHLVSHFVPFLPLERQHVRMCVRREIQSLRSLQGIGDVNELIDSVLSELQFTGPQDNFSVKGCKNVAEKLNYMISTLRFRGEL